MRINVAHNIPRQFTHEGAPAKRIGAEQQLRRSILSCLLWEKEFYEDGQSIAERIRDTAKECSFDAVANLAVEARKTFGLRHAPLLLLLDLIRRGGSEVAPVIHDTIGRADELTELVALYWMAGKRPLSKQMKTGLAEAFKKFDAYQLAKYDREGQVRLRDVLFLTHPKPDNPAQEALWKQLAEKQLVPPDTWEVALSGGADKRETFTRLLQEGKLGYLAVLRNLRNMLDANVERDLIEEAITARKGAQMVWPFRYVAAARAAPQLEPALDYALSRAIEDGPELVGKTAVLVDVSGSMNSKLSQRSDMTRMDAAAALASVLKGDLRIFTFSNAMVEVPPRRGMAGVDAVIRSQPHGGTYLGQAIATINAKVPHDRLIVITDEQSHDRVPDPVAERAYLINVASYQNGVGYGKWVHIDGFSEAVVRYIAEMEAFERQ